MWRALFVVAIFVAVVGFVWVDRAEWSKPTSASERSADGVASPVSHYSDAKRAPAAEINGRRPLSTPIADVRANGACDLSAPIEVAGRRSLALLVGINDYKFPSIPDLSGPENDVSQIYSLLVAEGGAGFPKENVCVLTGDRATKSAFVTHMEQFLIRHAEEGARIVIFFAGHGSQLRDLSGDETDGRDETWLFHDTGPSRVGAYDTPLLDDEFNDLMLRLTGAASDLEISVILDSCHSGSATRGDGIDTKIRAVENLDRLIGDAPASMRPMESRGDDRSWLERKNGDSASYTILSAAADGGKAIELKAGAGSAWSGVFTDAVYTAFARPSRVGWTYRDVEPEIRRRVQARSSQVPRVYGDLDASLVGDSRGSRPLGWQVRSTSSGRVVLGNGPLPGSGRGAVFRIYDRSTPPQDLSDPSKSKAQAEVTASMRTSAEAFLFDVRSGVEVEVGDYAILSNVDHTFRQMRFRLRPSSEKWGLSDGVFNALQSAFNQNTDLKRLARQTDGRAAFEVVQGELGTIDLIDLDGKVRNRFPADGASVPKIVEAITNHSRQTAIQQLAGEGGGMSDQVAVKVTLKQVEPSTSLAARSSCVNGLARDPISTFRQTRRRDIPVCSIYEVWAERTDNMPYGIRVGGLYLSSNGQMFALQRGLEPVFLQKKGDKQRLRTFQALPPIDIEESFMVFGVHEAVQMDWTRYETETRPISRSKGSGANALVRAFDDYTELRSRSGAGTNGDSSRRPFTLTSVPVRVTLDQPCSPSNLSNCESVRATVDGKEYSVYQPRQFSVARYFPEKDGTYTEQLLHEMACSSTNGRSPNGCSNPALKSEGLVEAVRSRVGLSSNGSMCEGGYRLGDIVTTKFGAAGSFESIIVDPDKSISWGLSPSSANASFHISRTSREWRDIGFSDVTESCTRLTELDNERSSMAPFYGQSRMASICKDPIECGG